MIITLDSENICGEDISLLEKFLEELSTSDVLDIHKMITEETNKRINRIK